MSGGFLPVSAREMRTLGWTQPDFVYVIGDAYVDHPSFGHAIISRVLEAAGYKVAIVSQPDWRDENSVNIFGTPRLGFLVTGGNMDSMVNHYSVGKHRRKTDAYTPGGLTGKRPDYATVVYCNLIRRTHPKIPILIGGIEASLRRLAHYDYWSEKLKRSILLDSQADLLLYGMGERSIVEAADALNSGLSIHDLTFIDGTVWRTNDLSSVADALVLPSYEELKADKRRYAESFYTQYCNTDPFRAKRLVEPYGREFVVQNPPQKPLSTQEMDDVYALPYQNLPHPSYHDTVPAISEVRFSLVSNRGCFGGCSFCAQPRIHPQGSARNDKAARLQGLHPRRRRPDGQFPPPGLRRPVKARRLPDEAVPVPLALQKSRRGSYGLHCTFAGAARTAGREKGLYPQRYPL